MLSYLLSALCFAFITAVEPVPEKPSERSGIRGAVHDGLVLVWGNVLLRSSTLVGNLAILFDNLAYAAFILYVTRTLALPPALLGLIFAAVGPGYLVGAVVAGDVRHGSTKRVASAVGEGAMAVRFVHEYLARL